MKHEGLYSLCGYAGTGKTTSLKALYKRCPDLLFLTPTHKAKSVLKAKLGDEALVMTTTAYTKSFKGTKMERMELAHFLETDPDKKAKLEKKMKALTKAGKAQEPVFGDRDRPEELIGKFIRVCVDEASMVTKNDRDKILKNADAVLFVGDGFQLPPVSQEADQDWFSRRDHNWYFDEVVRQGADSGILDLATQIRHAQGSFDLRRWVKNNREKYDDVFMVDYTDTMLQAISEDDCVALSFMNYVVDEMCYDVRRVLGHEKNCITPKDKLFAANNFGEFCNKDEIVLKGKFGIGDHHDVFGDKPRPVDVHNITQGFTLPVLFNDARLVAGLSDSARREKLSNKGLLPRFDYARTVHASQGSEWPTVVYQDEGLNMLEEEEQNRLIYTAVTRAQEQFVLLK